MLCAECNAIRTPIFNNTPGNLKIGRMRQPPLLVPVEAVSMQQLRAVYRSIHVYMGSR